MRKVGRITANLLEITLLPLQFLTRPGRWIFSVSSKDIGKIPCVFLVNLYWKLDAFVLEMGGISSTKFGEIGDGVFFDEEIFCKLDFMYRMAVYSN